MELHIIGKLTQITNTQEGTSQKGAWRKATAIFETQEQYPKTIAVDYFNSRLEEVNKIPLGTVCDVALEVSSREYNGKWYTSCSGIRTEAQQTAQPQPPKKQPKPQAPLDQQPGIDEEDDLPF